MDGLGESLFWNRGGHNSTPPDAREIGGGPVLLSAIAVIAFQHAFSEHRIEAIRRYIDFVADGRNQPGP